MGLQVAALGLLAVFILREHHLFEGLGSAISRLRWGWVGAALAAELASIAPLAEAQRLVLRAGGAKPPLWRVVLVTFASNAISMSVPAGFPVAEGYAYTKYRRYGARKAVAAWAELAAGAIAFSVLAALALAGALIAGGKAEVIVVPVVGVAWLGSLAAAETLRHPPWLVRGVEWLEGHVGRRVGGLVHRGSERARDMSQALKAVHPSMTLWIGAALLSAINWLLDTAALVLSFLAIGGRVPWSVALLAFAVAKVLSSFGITPGGIGVVEGGLVGTFAAYGTKTSTAVAGVILYRAITLIGLVGLGWGVAAVLAAEGHAQDAG